MSGTRTVDFDVHGLAGIRLVDAGPSDIAAVRRQLGPIEGSIAGQPDILLRFVDRLDLPGELVSIGLDEAAFTDDAFLVLRTRHKVRTRVRIPLERIGEPTLEIECERGLPAVPLLIPILNLTLLARGALALHAAAFRVGGVGSVVTGWSKGGKTEALLAFLDRGATYVADEWTHIEPGGAIVHGIPEPVRLWSWHLDEIRRGRRLVGALDRIRLAGAGLAVGTERALPAAVRRLPPGRAAGRLAPLIERQRFVDVPVETLVGGPIGDRRASFDRLFFVVSHDRPEIVVEPVDPDEVARRMVHSLQHERLDFLAWYRRFRFAFPDRSSPTVETAEEVEAERLRTVFAGKPAYRVAHPYPVSFGALHDAMRPYCS